MDFPSTLRIYPINTIINEYNLIYLEVLNCLAFIIKVINNPPSIKANNYTKVSNLNNKLTLVISNKVIFMKNFKIEEGLVNGSISTNIDII